MNTTKVTKVTKVTKAKALEEQLATKAKALEEKEAKKTNALAEKLAQKAQAVAEKEAKKTQALAEKLAKKTQAVAEKEEKQAQAEVQSQQVSIDIAKFTAFMATIENPHIILLRKMEVVQWLFGDTSFLPEIIKKNRTTDDKKYKIHEDNWGQAMMKLRRPDLKLDKQWTNKFGEHICEEIYTLCGKVVYKPLNKEHYQPDLEVDDAIIEAKAQTFYTEGTAGEKILGCPFKYAEIPELYSKPLKILCMGGAEKVCRERYGNLPGIKCSVQKKKFLDFFRENKIEYIGASDMLKGLSL